MSGELRQPRGLIKVNGQALPMIGWTWEGNSLYQADTFSGALALGSMPSGRGADWWGSQKEFEIELLAGFPAEPANVEASQLDSLFIGRADDISIDWLTRVVSFNGRDLTGDFIDNKTSEKFPNLTSSQIATKLAQKRGLTPVVTATSTKVGKFLKDSHVRMEDDRTEWDLLTWLAREEGFVVFVKGRELHFAPAATSPTYTIDVSRPNATQSQIKTTRVLTVAKDITVIVRSWNSKQKKTFVRKATRAKGSGPKVQQYVYTIPGLTPEQTQQRANTILADLSRHEMRLTVDGPADNTLTKSDLIRLTGTGTEFDQTYYPDVITRQMDSRGGYVWTVNAKNHSPESDANL